MNMQINKTECHCPTEMLVETGLDNNVVFPLIFECCLCQKLWVCSCFNGLYSLESIKHQLRIRPHEFLHRVDGLSSRPKLCALCTYPPVHVPLDEYMTHYTGGFVRLYWPYFLRQATLWNIELYWERPTALEKTQTLKIDNYLRKVMRFPLSPRPFYEYYLLNCIRKLVLPLQVIHHYRGEELEGLEIDFWIPEKRLALEYHGEQHFKPIKVWGGDEGLKQRKANDKKKRALCKKLGYSLITMTYHQKPYYNLVKTILERELGKLNT